MPTPNFRKSDHYLIEFYKVELSGICTCGYLDNCRLQIFEKGVIECKIFEHEPERYANMVSNTQKPEGTSSPASLKGICMNCDLISICKLPKAPAGVWHCEEYV